MIGGHGERVLLKIVAKYADMWNIGNADADEMKRLIGIVERHGDAVERETGTKPRSMMRRFPIRHALSAALRSYRGG